MQQLSSEAYPSPDTLRNPTAARQLLKKITDFTTFISPLESSPWAQRLRSPPRPGPLRPRLPGQAATPTGCDPDRWASLSGLQTA